MTYASPPVSGGEALPRAGRPFAETTDSRESRVECVHQHNRFDDEAATWDSDAGHEMRQLAVALAQHLDRIPQPTNGWASPRSVEISL